MSKEHLTELIEPIICNFYPAFEGEVGKENKLRMKEELAKAILDAGYIKKDEVRKE